MGMTSAIGVRLGTIRLIPLVPHPMPVIGNRANVGIGVLLEVLSPLPEVAGPLHHVEQVGNDAAGQEALSLVIEIDSPGIAGAVGEDFELTPGGVIPPDAGVEAGPFVVPGPGLTDVGVGEDSVAAIKPAIGSPDERIEGLVRVLVTPAIQQDLGRPIGNIVFIVVGNEQQLGSGPHPDAAKSHFDATDEVELVGEDGPLVELSIAIHVFENQDAVAGLFGFDPHRIGIGLGHPQPAPRVDGHRNRLLDVGFTGERRDPEPLGNGHGLGGIVRRESREFQQISGALGGQKGLLLKESEIIKIEVSPASRATVDQADEDRLPLVLLQVDHRPPQIFDLGSHGPMDDLLRIGADNLDAGFVGGTPGDQEGPPGMRHLEGDRGEGPGRSIALGILVRPHPESAGVLALHVLAAGEHRVSLDGLTGEGGSLGPPVLKGAGFKVEVERFPVGSLGKHSHLDLHPGRGVLGGGHRAPLQAEQRKGNNCKTAQRSRHGFHQQRAE